MPSRRAALVRWSVTVAVAAGLLVACGGADTAAPAVEELEGDRATLAAGADLYAANCAQCHGADLNGSATGPPFLDPVYAPDHHPDDAFRAAVAHGVTQHHWDFGPMPARDVAPDDVERIIAYVRAVQRSEGVGS